MAYSSLRRACRSTFSRPGFAVAAILLLALGAGANAAVFSVVRGVLLRPLSFTDPDRLVAVAPGDFLSNRDIDYLREHMRSLDHVAGLSPGWMMGLVPTRGDAVKVTGARISDNLFTTLGARPLLGRCIRPGDGPTRVVVLGHALWQSRFGSDEDVLGRSVVLDGQPHEIVGVMPPGFEILEPGTDLWTPLPFAPGTNHSTTFSQVLARLKPGVSGEAAGRELTELVPRMRRELSLSDDWGRTLAIAPLRASIVSQVRQPLLILLGGVGVVLLLASVNLATLALGRSLSRATEFAVENALGATRWRLVRQLLVEQLVVTLLGALAGLVVARAMLPALVARIPPEVPRVGEIRLDITVLSIVLAAAVCASVLASLGPVLLATRPSLSLLLRQSAQGPGRTRAAVLSALVAVQVGFAVVLGIGAALMLRTVWNLEHVDPGFNPDRVLAFRLQTTSTYRALDRGLPYFEEVVARIRAVPGVVAVGAINHLPMTGYSWTTRAWPEDRPPDPRRDPPTVAWRFIGWDYLRVMGVPVRAGREFHETDGRGASPVALVNEAMAQRLFGGATLALGRRLVTNSANGREVVEIVGVVGDIHHRGLDQPPEPELYRPLAQTFMFPMAFVVRTANAPEDAAALVRQAAGGVDRRVPVAELSPLPRLLAESIGKPRLLAQLLMAFAVIGLLLGLVGVYAVTAHGVRQREREIGIRLALGAPPLAIGRWVVGRSLAMVAAGVVVGLPLAFALGGVMRAMIFGVGPRDPSTYVGVSALVVLAAAAPAAIPARRATGVDPARTIRSE